MHDSLFSCPIVLKVGTGESKYCLNEICIIGHRLFASFEFSVGSGGLCKIRSASGMQPIRVRFCLCCMVLARAPQDWEAILTMCSHGIVYKLRRNARGSAHAPSSMFRKGIIRKVVCNCFAKKVRVMARYLAMSNFHIMPTVYMKYLSFHIGAHEN